MIRASPFAFSGVADLGGFLVAQEIESQTPHDSDVMLGMPLADAAFVFAKGGVQDPVDRVFEAPESPRGSQELFSIGGDWR